MNCKLLSLLLVAAIPASLTAQKVQAAPKVTDATQNPVPAGPPGTTPALPGKRPPQPNSWFPVTNQDLGTFFTNETAKGTFTFKNPHGDEFAFKHMAGSCQCSVARIRLGDREYEMRKGAKNNQVVRLEKRANGLVDRKPVTQIPVGPNEEGEIEVEMVMTGVKGTRQATLDIHTTDPTLPMSRLKWVATGAQLFLVTPKDVNLNQMTWNETREFTVTVRSPVQGDFNIVRMDDPGEEFDVEYEKTMEGGRAIWTIKGTYGPKSGEALGGGVLKFHTDIRSSSFMVRVAAMVQGPMEVKPGTFLTLGMIRRGKVKSNSVTFQPNDGTDLQATKIYFERLSVDKKFVTASQKKDGKDLVITLEVSPDAPRGLLRGDMIVELNHPTVTKKKILFNGYVR